VVTWLRKHPNLDVSNSSPITIGGVSGVSLNVKVSPVPKNYSAVCSGDPCIFLFGFTDENGVALWAGDPNRLIVLKDVAGETVIIILSGAPDKFEGFLSKAQQVLDTVEWQNAP
jgi:hypothetical protein